MSFCCCFSILLFFIFFLALGEKSESFAWLCYLRLFSCLFDVLYVTLGNWSGFWLIYWLINYSFHLFHIPHSLEWWSNDLYGWYICNLSHANCIIQFTIAPSQRHIHHQMHCSPVPHSSPPIIIAIIQLIVSQYPNRGLCEHTAT